MIQGLQLSLTDQTLSMKERVAAFKSVFPHSHLCVVNGHLEGLWIVADTARRSKIPSDYYGAYPPSYFRRIMAIFPDYEDKRVLHLFSGSIKDGLTIDVNPDLKPKICADAEHIPIRARCLDLILADPPYSKGHAKKYGTRWYSRIKALKESHRILKPRGIVAWLDLTYPPRHWKGDFNFKIYGLVSLILWTPHRPRLLTMLQKK